MCTMFELHPRQVAIDKTNPKRSSHHDSFLLYKLLHFFHGITIFFSNRTINRFFFGAVSIPTFFIISIKSSGDEASFGLGIGLEVVDAVATLVAGVATGTIGISVVGGATSDGTDDSIRATLGFDGGAVPNDDVESTSFSQDSRI